MRAIGATGIDLETEIKAEFPNVYSWAKRQEVRPAVMRAYAALSKQ